jgi:uncharacterized protein involved in exopolysaccharide biosynthesis
VTDERSTSRLRQATAREFIAVVFRRRWIIIGLFLVTTATIVTMTLTTPTRYQSVGRVLIKRGERESALQSYRRVGDWKEDLASEMEIMKSVPVATRAQALLDERGGPKLAFRAGQIDVQVVGQSNVVLMAYVDADPRVAERACDALVTAYVEQRVQASSVGYPKAFFDEQIADVSRQLDDWETRRRNFIAGAGLTDLAQQRQQLIGFRLTQKNRNDELETELAEARAELRAMEQMSGDPTLDLPLLSRPIGNEGVVVEHKNRMLIQEAKVAELRERLRDDSPQVVNALQTLESMRAMLRREVEGRLKIVRARVEVLEARMQPLHREQAETEKQLAAMPAQERTINEMDREIALLKARYQEITENADRARITQETSANLSVVVLSPAGAARPTNARDYVRLALAPAFSLVIGLGLAFFLDGLDSRVRTPLDVENSLDVPVLASITDRRRA